MSSEVLKIYTTSNSSDELVKISNSVSFNAPELLTKLLSSRVPEDTSVPVKCLVMDYLAKMYNISTEYVVVGDYTSDSHTDSMTSELVKIISSLTDNEYIRYYCNIIDKLLILKLKL